MGRFRALLILAVLVSPILLSALKVYPALAELSEFNCDNVTEISTPECEALAAFYNSTQGPNWVNHSGWLDTDTPCSWYGVTCSGGHVTQLVLSENGVSGILPGQIGDLVYLQHLEAPWNGLGGNLPPQLGNLTSLRRMSLYFNHLSGSIPAEMGNMIALQSLDLHSNQLGGSVPTQLCDPPSLTSLNLRYNKISSAPPCITALSPGWAETQVRPPDDVSAIEWGANAVQMRWTPVQCPCCAGYYLFYRQIPNGGYAYLDYIFDGGAGGYLVNGLTAGETYDFAVQTFSMACQTNWNALESALSSPGRATPGTQPLPPSAPAIQPGVAAGAIVLSWEPVIRDYLGNAETVIAYEVHRSASPYFTPESATLVATVYPAGGLSHTDSGVVGDGKAHYYRIVAVNDAGQKSWGTDPTGEFEFEMIVTARSTTDQHEP